MESVGSHTNSDEPENASETVCTCLTFGLQPRGYPETGDVVVTTITPGYGRRQNSPTSPRVSRIA